MGFCGEARASSISARRRAAGRNTRPSASGQDGQGGARSDEGRVVALDLLDLEPIEGVTFAKLDFLALEAPGWIIAALGGKADVVLSDMAANTTGHRKTDHLRIMALAEAAAEFAGEILAPGGAFLAKVLQGGTETALLASLKRDFTRVKHVKPAASRADSAELYLLAMGFRRATGEARP